MRVAYFGTPEVAAGPLRALHAAGHEVRVVVSGPDRRRGRGGATSPSPVKATALELGLDVRDDPDAVVGSGAELGVVVAYGRLIRPHLLAEMPMVNLHFSLLPRWRGAAPVERAILAGDRETGVCLMAVEEGLDTGGVHRRHVRPLDEQVTAAQLRAQLAEAGTALLLDALEHGLGAPEPQSSEGITYAAKLTSADRRIDFHAPAVQVHRVVRVGGAWTTFRGARMKVHTVVRPVDPPEVATGVGEVAPGLLVRCGDGEFVGLHTVQPEGRPSMDAGAWANGADPVGERIGE